MDVLFILTSIQTSNVFVANLPANITEYVLGNFFAARCGPVGSVSLIYYVILLICFRRVTTQVKIMWPRGDGAPLGGPGVDMTASRARRPGLSGFVSFMKRKDAEKAVREIDGFDWGGSVLRVGWSKAVPIAAKPAYVGMCIKYVHGVL